MKKRCYIAIDLGATSGRVILGSITSEGRLSLEEVSRFPNEMMEVNGHLHWNIYSLYKNIIDGLRKVAALSIEPVSIGVDTWGVDFGCIDPDGNIIGLPYAYRDSCLAGASERFFKNVMSAADLYALTGIQHADYNTVFQLNEHREDWALRMANKIAFTPDLICYLLTGELVTEYTIASTGGLLNPYTRRFDGKVLASLGLTEEKFGPLVEPGSVIGTLREDVARLTGLSALSVVAVGEHDTSSAVAAVPSADEKFAYLSSGTWSLMGIETDEPVVNEVSEEFNITNEGGVNGTVRVLKNLTGLWIVEECLRAWRREGTAYSYPEMVMLAENSPAFVAFIDTDAPEFIAPRDMPEAIREYCRRTGQRVPSTHGEIIRMIFESLAMKYKKTFDVFERLSEHPIERLHVIGGGSRNRLLNQFAANAIGLPVIAGPAEATAIGNIMMQVKACGEIDSIHEIRAIVAGGINPEVFKPSDAEVWAHAYEEYETKTSRR